MDRDAFISLLIRAVKDSTVTEDEARDLLRHFDAGDIQLDEDETPLDLSEAITPVTESDVEKAIRALLTLGTLSYLHLRRARFREVLQDRFIERAKGLAKAKATGKLAMSAWQQGMGEEIRSHIIQQVAVGSGRIPAANALTEAVGLQDAYLSRWADELTIKTLMGNPASELGMMTRAALYAGAGRAEGYRAEAEDLPEGYVAEYVSQDDDGTCADCLDAEGVYPLDESYPLPGQVCRGYGNCRCRIEYRSAA